MSDLEKLIKALKDAKEVIEKDDELKGKVEAIMRQKMHEKWGEGAGKKIADHYRDIDESIPAKQRSNIKAGLKTQEEKAAKPKLAVVKAEELADTLIKSLKALNKEDEEPNMKRAPVNGQSGWSQDGSTGAFHHKLHGVVSTFKAPDGGFSVRHNGKDLGSFGSIGEAGSKIKEHMGWLGSLKQGAAAYPSANGRIVKDDGGIDAEGETVNKSNYGPKGAGLYNPADNIKRKAGNTGDVAGEGPNQNVKSYSSKPGQLSAKAQAALEQARDKNKNKKQPVKTYTPEEIAEMNAKLKKSTEWNENELAGKLSAIIPFNSKMQLQPTDAQLEEAAIASGIAVTPAQAEAMAKGHDSAITDWFKEATKPISSRFANEEEELEYWASLRITDKPDNGPGY